MLHYANVHVNWTLNRIRVVTYEITYDDAMVVVVIEVSMRRDERGCAIVRHCVLVIASPIVLHTIRSNNDTINDKDNRHGKSNGTNGTSSGLNRVGFSSRNAIKSSSLRFNSS